MFYSLRPSIPADKPAIEALFIQMLQSIYHTQDAVGYEPGYLDRFYAGGEDWICVAESLDQVIGFLSIEVHLEEKTPFLYLDDFCVAEAYRGMGIGSELLDQAESFAVRSSIHRIILHVEKSNTAASHLYQKRGYQVMTIEQTRCKMALQLQN